MDFWTPTHREDKKKVLLPHETLLLAFQNCGVVLRNGVENARLVGTVDMVFNLATSTNLDSKSICMSEK
jgi:hypothetical protein